MHSEIKQLREKVNTCYHGEERLTLLKVLDKGHTALRSWSFVGTDFLDPFKRVLALDILLKLQDLHCYEFGAYADATRKSLVLAPKDLIFDHFISDDMFSLASITPVSKQISLTHRDYLGAIMSLGIKREFFGDILINPSGCMIPGKKGVIEAIMNTLVSVGAHTVSVTQKPLSDIIVPEETADECLVNVSSLRMDCIISAAFHISRSEAADLIRGGKAYVNYKEATDPAKQIKPDGVLSCRGFGKLQLLDILGETKKGRLKIKIKIFA